MQPRKRTILFAVVFTPVMIAGAVMLWSNLHMLDGISMSVEKLDEKRTWQAVESAFDTEVKRISGLLVDNASWDDAAERVYGKLDEAWVEASWGVSTSDTNYDTSFLVDHAGNTVLAFKDGQKFDQTADVYFGEAIKRLRQELPQDTKSFQAAGTIVQTNQGLAVMSMAPVHPYSELKTVPTNKPIYLVLSRSIRDQDITELAEQYVVADLRLTDPNMDALAPNQLRDRWKRPLATAIWERGKMGKAARDGYFWNAFASIAALLGAMTPLAIYLGNAIVRLELNERLSHERARRDVLSGLPNRRALYETLDRKMKSAKEGHLALLLIDLDGFKAVNDTFDHATGDKLIKAVASGLGNLLDKTHFVARLGGDEFAVLVQGPEVQSLASDVAHDILQYLREPFDLDGRQAVIGASIGVAIAADGEIETGDLMRRADVAMYNAKETGRARVKFYNTSLDEKRSDDLAIAAELRSLLAVGDLDVAYQPIVQSGSNEIVGVEVLARWPKSSSRQLRPDQFIPVAEEFGLIDALSLIVLKNAFADISMWPGLRLSVNVSPLQLNNPRFLEDLVEVAESKNFNLNRLEIEFTEAILISNHDRAKSVIEKLQALGISIALDDFGQGYASVGYLREFKFDTIKLDRSLTQNLAKGTENLQVIQGAILLAKGLSAEVVAEGIETMEEAQIMHVAGCQFLQGYYFGRPQAASDISRVLCENVMQEKLQQA